MRFKTFKYTIGFQSLNTAYLFELVKPAHLNVSYQLYGTKWDVTLFNLSLSLTSPGTYYDWDTGFQELNSLFSLYFSICFKFLVFFLQGKFPCFSLCCGNPAEGLFSREMNRSKLFCWMKHLAYTSKTGT